MRLRFFDRFIIVLAALILLVLALGVLAMVWNLLDYDLVVEYIDRIYFVDMNFWVVTGSAVVVLILVTGLFFVGFGRTAKSKKAKFVNVAGITGGELRIAKDSLAEMFCKEINSIEGVNDSKVRLDSKSGTLSMSAKVGVDDGYNLPAIAVMIQDDVKAKIISMTGLDIAQVDVMIDNH